MKSVITGILFLLSLGACGRGTVESRIAGRVENTCAPSAPCVIRVGDVTDFEWDKMYVFRYSATREQVRQALGTDLPERVEFSRKIVFSKGGRVVYNEELPGNIESVVEGQVLFGIPADEAYIAFTRDAAVFSAEKKKFDGRIFYELRQVGH